MSLEGKFEYVTRAKLRWPSSRGQLSIEQLWDAPLRSKNDFDLNAIAKDVSKTLKSTEENFVETAKNAERELYELLLDVVKYVIDTKLREEEAAKRKAANKVEKQKLLAILAEKKDGALSALSEKELQERIAALET